MTRFISGALLAAAALSAILFLPIGALRVVAIVVALLASHEYVRVAGTGRGLSEVLVAVAVMVTSWFAASGMNVDPLLLLVMAMAWVAVEVLFIGPTLHQAAVALLAPVYVGLPLGLLVLLHATWGWQTTLLLLATIVVSDSGQYYTGRAFGRTPLAPAISPKKTREGAVGGIVLGTAIMAVGGRVLHEEIALAAWVGIGVAIVTLGILGDLFESRLKRTAGMKDSSALIPGHGGVLDRIDALLFAIPAFYLFLRAQA